MNNFILLLKTSFIEQYKINKVFKRDNLLRNILFGLLILIISAFIFFYMYMTYSSVIIIAEDPSTIVNDILELSFFITFILLFITTFTQAHAYLFKGKDFEMLVSLPISNQTIVSVKVANILINNYITAFFTMMPVLLLVLINNLVSPIFYFNMMLIYITFPLLLLSVVSLLTFVFALIFRNFKYKNLALIILGVGGLVTYMTFIFTMQAEDMAMFGGIASSLKYLYYPAILAIKALVDYNFIALILYLALNILAFIGFIYIIGKIYLKANTGLLKSSNVNKKHSKVSQKGVTKSLFNIEMKKYLSLPSYVMNTVVGKLLFPILLVVFSQSFKGLEGEALDALNILIVPLIAGIGVFTLTLTATTSTTISLEGDSIWLLKSAPIKASKIFVSKMLVDIVPSFIIVFITMILSFIIFPSVDILQMIILFIFLIILSVHNSTLGLIVNLKFPKLKWDLPVRVIKQSFSVILHMLISFGSLIVLIPLIILLTKGVTSITIIFALVTILYTVVLIIESLILFKLGPTWFNKL